MKITIWADQQILKTLGCAKQEHRRGFTQCCPAHIVPKMQRDHDYSTLRNVFLDGTDIANFKDFLGAEVATLFRDEELPQLRRELWTWANLVLDLCESGALDHIDSAMMASYDNGIGPGRGRKPFHSHT